MSLFGGNDLTKERLSYLPNHSNSSRSVYVTICIPVRVYSVYDIFYAAYLLTVYCTYSDTTVYIYATFCTNLQKN